jgi:hypothetical protein
MIYTDDTLTHAYVQMHAGARTGHTGIACGEGILVFGGSLEDGETQNDSWMLRWPVTDDDAWLWDHVECAGRLSAQVAHLCMHACKGGQ